MKKHKIQQAISMNANEGLLKAANKEAAELLKEYQNNLVTGYDDAQVEEMRGKYGENIITHRSEMTTLKRLFNSFINPFTIILLILAIVSFFTDFFSVKNVRNRDLTPAIIVLVMVVVSGVLRFIQESKSSKAADQLKSLIKTTICVMRKEQGKIEIPLEEVVVGDIVYLAAGDMVPADIRVISCKDLFVSESSLTGEIHPIEKIGSVLQFSHKNSLELRNLAFMGTNVVSGSATGIVINIGDDTHFGIIAKSIVAKKALTSFEKGVNSVSWLLIRFMLFMVPVVFFINGWRKGDWLDALLFGLSIAVGLTPEMLPMIVTTGLAKGAVKLAKKKTVIKNINSIQNFGAIDILCTDKTGTLTQDKIVLEKYLDIHGNEDFRILRHAFLNSYFQTGMKNLMDIAILDHSKDNGIPELINKYQKVDEIPFDFTRRRMSVVIKDSNDKTQLITKGAIEEMLSICSFAEYEGKVEPLTADIKNTIISMVQKLNEEGMRVLGVAQKTNPAVEGIFSIKDESEMVLIGYLSFLDPPKESAKSAIKALEDYGIDVKILTGDNLSVAKCIGKQVGIYTKRTLLGQDIEEMSDETLSEVVEKVEIFAKLTPQHKTRIVNILRQNGHVVGFMGDGINDAAAIHAADVGISVDSAVDIAKESADVILLEKDLMVLERGIIEGRKTFANIIKYIKMTASSNFGNMFSVLVACYFLPFLPMLPVQILMLNLIYDISCISIPWDNVDKSFIDKPKKWDASSISKFMFFLGPVSSILDIITFIILFFIICPNAMGGSYNTLNPEQQLTFIALFQAGWFIESLWTQMLVIHMIRTPKIPFFQSRASWPVIGFTTIAMLIGTIISITPLGEIIKLGILPGIFFVWLVGIIFIYILLTTIIKRVFIKKFKELL